MAPTETVPAPPRTFHEAQVTLRSTLPGYEERAEQALLATTIEDCWEDGSILVGQAGTGTGKSLASLIPAILSGKRTVYSTATKALQSQIMDKDLPFLATNLGVKFSVAMLQGRSNYFCHQKATDNAAVNPVISENLQAFMADDKAHLDDGLLELSGLREALPYEVDNVSWSRMTISADECPRKKCPFYADCRFQRAKDIAMRSQVVVANHALVALDGRISEQSSGNASILGEIDHLIVDECHELEDFITSALTWQQSFLTYKGLQSDLVPFFHSGDFKSDDADEIEELAMNLTAYADQFFATYTIEKPAQSVRVRHGKAVENSATVESMITAIMQIQEIMTSYNSDLEEMDKATEARFTRLESRIVNLRSALMDFLFRSDAEIVRVFEMESRGANQVKVLKIIPVRIGEWAREWLWERVTPILISATCLVDGKPDFLVDRLGLGKVRTVDVGSPFDFDKQSRLYIPEHITEPTPAKRAQWEAEMMPLMEELVQISDGRALLLFTSKAQMQKAWDTFAHRIVHPCRMQGDLPNAQLTRWFREETNSVLFATRSFFTGIDIQGDSLSLVVIDKLPFPVPTDPVIEARAEDVKRRGGNDFAELTIPLMTLVLQQAFGRLIRTKGDHGVVAIMDPRLQTKSYGSKIRRSLPAPVTFDLNEVETFFESIS